MFGLRLLCFCTVFFLLPTARSPAALNGPGDIAYVGWNADGNNDFAFVALVDIGPFETIRFTDNEWLEFAFSTGEGDMTWTAPAGGVARGTVITINSLLSSPSASTGSIAGSFPALSTADEALFAVLGTLAAPNAFLAAFSNDGPNGFTTLSNTGLTAGTTAIDFAGVGTDHDVFEYTGGRAGESDFSGYLPLINNPDNWISQDGGGDQSSDGMPPDLPFDSTSFAINAAVLTSNPAAGLDFGSAVCVGDSPSLPLDITNEGDADAASISITDPASYSTAPAADFSLDIDETKSFTVTYTPTSAGTDAGNIEFDPDAGATLNVPVSGTGINPVMDAALAGESGGTSDFGSAKIGDPSATTRVLTVSNTGDTTLGASAALGGTHDTDWSMSSGDCTGTSSSLSCSIDAGESVAITLTFTPLAHDPSAREATVTVDGDSRCDVPGQALFNLTGTTIWGTANLTMPTLTLNQYDFGDHPALDTPYPAAVTFEVTNAGTATLDITSITKDSATDCDNFLLTTGVLPSEDIAIAATETFTIQFAPQEAGDVTCEITVASDDPETPSLTFDVTGHGQAPVLTVTPAGPIDFGELRPLDTSGAQPITIRNDGDFSMTVSDVALDDDTDFDIEPFTAGTVLDPAELVEVDVWFNPQSAGPKSSLVTITTDNPVGASMATVDLLGVGVQPELNITPDPLSIGSVVVGDSATGNFTFFNPGGSELAVTAIAFSGSASGQFSVDEMTPFSIAAGAGRPVTARCGPTSVGLKSANIIATSDAANVPPTPEITCTGVKPDIAVSPTSLNFGVQAPGTTSPPQIFTVSNANTAFTSSLAVTIAESGTNAIDFSATPTDFTLVPGQDQDVSITFSPSSPGLLNAVIEISSDDQETPRVDLTVNGIGFVPRLTLLVVDDDDNAPDLRGAYEAILNSLNQAFQVWDTNGSDSEPDTPDLDPFEVVFWFTGGAMTPATGPSAASEKAIGAYLEAGGCFVISSQDYLLVRGGGSDTPTMLMSAYLGLASGQSDQAQTQVFGQGAFSALGTQTLDFATPGIVAAPDVLNPQPSAASMFAGNAGPAAIGVIGLDYKTLYLGFPFSTLPQGRASMASVLEFCSRKERLFADGFEGFETQNHDPSTGTH